MNPISFDLQPGWLRRHEVESPCVRFGEAGPHGGGVVYKFEMKAARSFGVSVGGEAFVLTVQHVPDPGSVVFTGPGEEERAATDQEILILFARAFLGSLPVYPQPEPDLEKGWEAFRRQRAETKGWGTLPWEKLDSEAREEFAAAVRAAVSGAAPEPYRWGENRTPNEEAADRPSGPEAPRSQVSDQDVEAIVQRSVDHAMAELAYALVKQFMEVSSIYDPARGTERLEFEKLVMENGAPGYAAMMEAVKRLRRERYPKAREEVPV